MLPILPKDHSFAAANVAGAKSVIDLISVQGPTYLEENCGHNRKGHLNKGHGPHSPGEPSRR